MYLTAQDCSDAVLQSQGTPASQGNLLPRSSTAASPGLHRGGKGCADPEAGAGGAGGVGTGCCGASPGVLLPRSGAQAQQGQHPACCSNKPAFRTTPAKSHRLPNSSVQVRTQATARKFTARVCEGQAASGRIISIPLPNPTGQIQGRFLLKGSAPNSV